MPARSRVVFHVIAVVKEKQIINAAVMARGASRMFIMALQITEEQTQQAAGQPNTQPKSRGEVEYDDPKSNHQARFGQQLRRNLQSKVSLGMMCQMPLLP